MRSFVGIDIGSDAVKLVMLKKTRKGLVVKKAGYLPLSEIPFSEGMSAEDISSEAMRWLLEQNQLKRVDACVALSSQDVYTKYITLPPVTADKVDQIVQFEARQQIPFPLEEVCWDYQVLGADQTTGQAYVVFHAVKEPRVRSLMNYVSSSQVEVSRIDVSSMALYNILVTTGASVGSILLDIGKTTTQIVLLDEKGCWTRSVDFAGDHLNQYLVEKLDMYADYVEQFKRTVGLQGEGADGERSQHLKDALVKLIEEIKKNLDYYMQMNPDFSITTLYLTGGNVRIHGMTDVFAEYFSADIEVLDPFHNIEIDPKVGHDHAGDLRHFFGTAFGLALGHVDRSLAQINLLPEDIVLERSIRKRSFVLWMSVVFLVGIFTIQGTSQQKVINNLRNEWRQSQKEMKMFRSMEADIKRDESAIKPLEKKLQLFASMVRQRSFVMDMLLQIKKVTINDVYYEYLRYGFDDEEIHQLEQRHFEKENKATGRRRTYKARVEKEIRSDELVIHGVVSDSYRKIDSLKIAMESFSFIKLVSVDIAKEDDEEQRKKIEFDLKAKVKQS